MKITRQCYIAVILSIVSITIGANLRTGSKYPFSKANTREALIGIVKLAMGKGSFENENTPVATCFKKLSTDKEQHLNAVNQFWAKVEEHLVKNSIPRPLEKNDFLGLFSSFRDIEPDSILVGNQKKNCKAVLSEALLDDPDIEKAKGQMQDFAIPCFDISVRMTPEKKNYMSAFTSVHKNSIGGETLLHNLNQRKKTSQ